MGEYLRRLRYYFRRREFEAELEEEMQHHRSLSGNRQFGNLGLVKEDSRAMWGWTLVEQFAQDLRYALRSMAGNRVFTALAVASLALGIGANTAIYSFMESILLRSLPVRQPESLVTLSWNMPPPPESSRGKLKGPVEPKLARIAFASTGASYFDPNVGQIGAYFPYDALTLFQSQRDLFQSVFGYIYAGLDVQANGRSEQTAGTYVSGDYFRGLGVFPAAGRLLDAHDDHAGAPPVAVLSHAFWTRRLAADPGAVGETIRVNNHPVTVVGIAPPEFFGIDSAQSPDLYLPLHANVEINAGTPRGGLPWYTDTHFYWLEMMARLQPGVTREQTQAAVDPRFRQFAASTASSDEESAALPGLLVREGAGGLDVLRRSYSQPLYVLMTLVGLILAITCANIANLLLARGAARNREMAVRLSMGAGRWRVIRQMLTESVLLASLGGAAGVALALAGIRSLTALLANGRENFTLRAELNWNVLAVTACLALVTGLLFGIAPALRATRVDVMPALKECRSGESRRRRGRLSLSRVLLVGQVAMSLLLLVAAGLFVRTLGNLEGTKLGFNPENVLLFSVNARDAGVAAPDTARFFEDLRERLAAMPGVRGATYSNLSVIGAGSMSVNTTFPGGRDARAWGLYVGPEFFGTMQIPLLSGRGIDARDRVDAPTVAVVNALFARAHFGGENPIGKTFRYDRLPAVEIVGIAGNTRYLSLKDTPEPVVFLPTAQASRPQMGTTFELRTAGDPLSQANAVQALMRQIDQRISVTRIRSQEDQIARTINQEIVFARLCTGFAALALLIACVGLYGSTAYNVTRRTGEIGIRMALGAQRGRVLRMVLREAALLCAIGLAIGVPAALAASRFVESFLFEMKPNDPVAIGGAMLILVTAALIAAFGPARRASRIDPMAALRHE